MKQFLSGIAAILIAATLVTGCGDDGTTDPPGGGDQTSVKYAANEKYTFHLYDRDNNNMRVDASKKVVVWTVLRVDQSIGGRAGVAVVEEATYDVTGTTKQMADTFYFHANATDGGFSQYNLLRNVVNRIPGGALFKDSIPEKWILVGNTKKADAGIWDAVDGGGPINRTVTIQGFPAQVTFAMNATHKGKQSVTVPKGAYADGFHTDHNVIFSNTLFSTTDTLKLSYDINAKDGMLRQVLNTAKVFNGAQTIPGFEMELVSIAR